MKEKLFKETPWSKEWELFMKKDERLIDLLNQLKGEADYLIRFNAEANSEYAKGVKECAKFFSTELNKIILLEEKKQNG